MSDISHVQKLIAKKLVFVNFLSSVAEDGQKIFYYIASYTDQLLRLHQSLKRKDAYLNPTDYGIVIKWGYGQPSDDIKKEMKENFKFDHDKVIKIAKAEAA